MIISFESELKPTNSEITKFLASHGDTIQDIAFEVEDIEKIFSRAVQRGAKVVSAPEMIEDENGSVIKATIHGFGDTVHTLIEPVGKFLPEIILRAIFAWLQDSLHGRADEQVLQ